MCAPWGVCPKLQGPVKDRVWSEGRVARCLVQMPTP